MTFLRKCDALSGLAEMEWDVLSGVTKVARDVLSGMAEMAWDVLSRVSNLCWMFCPGCQKMAWDVLSVDVLSGSPSRFIQLIDHSSDSD